MDLVVGLPNTVGKFYSIWVMVDIFTNSAHFIVVMVDYIEEPLAKIYVKEIVRSHWMPLSITSKSGILYTSKFWRNSHDELDMELTLLTTFHRQKDE